MASGHANRGNKPNTWANIGGSGLAADAAESTQMTRCGHLAGPRSSNLLNTLCPKTSGTRAAVSHYDPNSDIGLHPNTTGRRRSCLRKTAIVAMPRRLLRQANESVGTIFRVHIADLASVLILR
jgi:hypothetical protein